MQTFRHWLAAGLTAALIGITASSALAAGKDGETFQDWRVRCAEDPQNLAAGGCFIFQSVVNNETQQPVMQIAIGYLPEGQAPAVVITLPLGVRVAPGVLLQIDENEAIKLPFERCLPEGCKVQFRLDETNVAAFKAGVAGKIAFQNGGGRNMTLPFSLKGFTAALASIQ